MNSPKKDYNRLYQLQDKFLTWWVTLGFPFYLTGGTALGRFYLNHRFSEDLDFFVNADTRYNHYIAELKAKITSRFSINIQQSLFSDDFTRFFLTDDDVYLKIELDVEQRLIDFPVKWLETVSWLPTAMDLGSTQNLLNQIANDFFLGKENSLGKHQPPIESATPLV